VVEASLPVTEEARQSKTRQIDLDAKPSKKTPSVLYRGCLVEGPRRVLGVCGSRGLHRPEITLKWTYGAVGAKAKKRKIKLQSGDSYAQVQAAIEGENGEGKVLVEYDDADGDQYEMDDEDSWREVLTLAMGRDGRVLEVHVS